jgi:NAD(P)-dependent dehydrogenase (short-subunit alcohol dehydrogenase family)
MRRLEGKVCVITGAGGGIGREAALLFSEEGARVCVADVDEQAAEKTASECRDAFFFPADVTREDSVRQMYSATVERYGGIDVLYNNAGIMPPDDGSVLETALETWHKVLAVNLTGVFLCCKHGIPHLLERGGGSVINVASFVAVMGAATSQISYTASKGAVLAMSREMAVEFARRNIRVNALCPGPVETPLLRHLLESSPEARARRVVHLPPGRFAQADEIAKGALFLAGDESSYVNGATFLVDGGLTAAYVTAE